MKKYFTASLEVFIMDITKMTDQQIIEHMRSRGADNAIINTVISQSIEDFYTKHGIVLRCPHCGSKEKSRNGKNSSGKSMVLIYLNPLLSTKFSERPLFTHLK